MKHLIKGFAITAAALLAVGCASNAASPSASDSAEPLADSISIVVAQYSTGTQAHWEKIIADFNQEYPDVKVDLQVLDWGTLTPTVNTLIQTEQYPDILNFGNWADYADAGLLYSADEVLPADKVADFLPTFADNSKLDGKQYALPYVASINVMYYNEDILKAADITEPPTTFAEMLTACEKVKAHDSSIYTYALALGAVGGTAEATLWAS
ncbi:MAG: extracellular solute-binding protein, partial [Propionibacteriaceae bacterium]|nr:extracellular solute-binding protein [Propionibacteriaceae bacterium]